MMSSTTSVTSYNGQQIAGAGLIKESFYVFNSLESILAGNELDFGRIHSEVEKLLKLMTPADIDMFYIFLLRLFDRVFGEDCTGCKDYDFAAGVSSSSTVPSTSSSSTTPAPGTKAWLRGTKGGWLGSSGGNLSKGLGLLLDLLLPQSRMMSIPIHRGSDQQAGTMRKSFEMSLSVFPLKMRMRVARNPFNECTNVFVSYNYEAKFKSMRSLNGNGGNQTEDSTVVFVDPLEYFLICLVRHPLTVPERHSPTYSTGTMSNGVQTTKSLFVRGPTQWAKSMSYFSLLSAYVDLLLPNGWHADDASKLPEGSELFLALAVDFWLDNSRVVKRNFALAEALKRPGSASAQAVVLKPLDADLYPGPLETVLIDSSDLGPWTLQSLMSVYFVLHRLTQHKALAAEFDSLQTRFTKQKEAVSKSPPNSLAISTGQRPVLTSYLPHAFHLIQSPLFETLKLILSKGDVLPTSTFYAAVELWLLYIQPWGDKAAYSAVWRSYVMANLHFYTTLLAVFLRTASRLDMTSSRSTSSSEFGLLEQLDRTLLVFTDLLNDTIDTIHSAVFKRLRNQDNVPVTPLRGSESAELLSEPGLSAAELEVAVAHHFDTFPDPGIVTCTDAGLVVIRYHARDASKLIVESMYTLTEPPARGVLEKIGEYFFGKEGPDAAAKRASSIVHQLTDVLGIVDRILLTNRQRIASFSASDVLDADRSPGGYRLTSLGKSQLLRGQKRCSKRFVHYRGDQIDRPLTSTEWRHLARLLISVSKRANTKLELPLDASAVSLTWRDVLLSCSSQIWETPYVLQRSFRINLRALADIRVLGLLLALLVRKCYLLDILGFTSSLLLVVIVATVSYLQFNSHFLVN